MRASTICKRPGGTLGLWLVLWGTLAAGCTSVKFVQKNPYTGEIWTVYQHNLSSDTITYCPAVEGASCMEAVLVDGPPAPQTGTPVAPPQ